LRQKLIGLFPYWFVSSQMQHYFKEAQIDLGIQQTALTTVTY